MRISDWSSDVCSSDLARLHPRHRPRRLDHRPPMSERDALASLERLVSLLDDRFSVGGFRFGLDGLLRLVPGVGDSLGALASAYLIVQRSEERRVRNECVRTCRSRWSPHHKKKK